MTTPSCNVTGNGNPDPIPPDLGGRVLWAAKHFGVLTLFAAVLLWQGSRFIEMQREERQEQGQFFRETLISVTGESTKALIKAANAIEEQSRMNEKMLDAIKQNGVVMQRICPILDQREGGGRDR